MNTEIIKTEIGKLIENRKLPANSPWHICWWENKLQCLPQNHTSVKHKTFGKISAENAIEGLTNKQWTRIAGKVATFMEEQLS